MSSSRSMPIRRLHLLPCYPHPPLVQKLIKRFDVNSYLTLIGAMDAHDVGLDRGGVGPALGAFKGKLTGVGIPGDLLYTPGDVKRWVEAAGTHGAQVSYREIISGNGHDAFLLEPLQVQNIIGDALGDSRKA